MARNQEKAQSMLYRFREAQAAELGFSTRSDKRPRMASSVKDIRQCEKWRGEIMKEISRKVSKIQDPGLTDYEVRDLNDEINGLLREKSHWETQIINLGGANYRRAGIATTDADGRTIPGQRGYKYFGRAKDLPGVKELFEGAAREQEELEALKKTEEPYKAFKDQGPAYFGDLDELDGELLKAEEEEERQAWEDAYEGLAATLGVSPSSLKVPPLPVAAAVDLSSKGPAEEAEEAPVAVEAEPTAAKGKRKAATAKGGKSKKAKSDAVAATAAATGTGPKTDGYVTVLTADDLRPPGAPTKQEMDRMIMGLQKAALLREYVGA